MTYAIHNYRTKQELVAAVEQGGLIRLFTTGPAPPTRNGFQTIQGPWPMRGGTLSTFTHRWEARVRVLDGVVVEVE